MFVAFSVGKWVQEVCDELYELIAKRTQQPTYYNKISFCTDGNDQNENAILRFFNKDCVNYGQIIKDKEKQKVIGSHKRKVLGTMSYDKISIAHVDGLCKAFRERGKCFVRRASTFAKKRETIWIFMAVYQAYHNTIKVKEGETPCMREGMTNHVWSWGELLNTKISVEN